MIRTFITTLCILILLVSLLIFENNIVYDYSDTLQSDAYYMKNSTDNISGISDSIDSIISEWKQKKDSIYIFSNHNTFNEIENEIYIIEYYVRNQNIPEMKFHIDNLCHRADELKESLGLSFGNIL